MVTIILPPELEKIVTEKTERQGTTPEIWTVEMLRQTLHSEDSSQPASEIVPEGGTMLDFFEGYVGVLHSSEFVPGGAQMSTDSQYLKKSLIPDK